MKEEVDFENSPNNPLRNLKSNQLIHKEMFLDMNAPISPGRDGQLSPGALSLTGKLFFLNVLFTNSFFSKIKMKHPSFYKKRYPPKNPIKSILLTNFSPYLFSQNLCFAMT